MIEQIIKINASMKEKTTRIVGVELGWERYKKAGTMCQLWNVYVVSD